MKNKNYVKPSMKVFKMEMSMIVCQSGGDFNYIPTIPGQPKDEKHLA